VRDAGLKLAIDAAGGVAELARNIDIAQPSVSNWNIYSERVVPDDAIDPIDAGRAQEYALLATLLLSAPSAVLLEQIAQLKGDATPLGRAHATLADAASIAVPTEVEREYFDLFVGLGRGELLPYASYYLTGFLNERPLSRLRDDLAALGVERMENNFEPEDHAAALCEIMAGLAAARFPAPPEAQRAFFEKHMSRWMGRFFADMEKAENAKFYRSVGTLGRVLLEIETEAFTFAN
jgi:TorA maturation chaperone TorD